MKRILYVESSRGGIGGSLISLLTLIRHLDRGEFEPSLLLIGSNPMEEEFRLACRRLVVWRDVTLLDENEAAADLSRVAQGLSSWRGVSNLYSGASAVLRLATNDLPLAARFAGLVRELQADLVHANNRVHANAFAILGASLAGVPVVVHERLLYNYTAMDRYVSRQVALLCCISRAVQSATLSGGLRPAATTVIDNPVEMTAGRQLGRPLRLVTFIGRLVPWKGAHVFVEACGGLARRFPGLEFVVVGGPGLAGRDYAATLEARARALGLMPRMRFTGEIRGIAEVLAQADILVHASVTPEPFGRVVAEAMSEGLPVVATRGGGPDEMIEDGVTGLLVEPGSAVAIESAVSELLENPAAAAAMGRRAQRVAEKRFTPAVHASRMAGHYRRLLQPSRMTAE